SKRLVELMDGTIGFRSTPGKGSVFFFTLPRREESAPARAYEPAAPLAPTHDPSPAPGWPPVVLAVEDTATDARLIHDTLVHAGYTASIASNAEEALAILPRGEVRALIVDLGLPGASGSTLIDHVRAMPATRGLPIMVLTARDLSTEERAHLEHTTQL